MRAFLDGDTLFKASREAHLLFPSAPQSSYYETSDSGVTVLTDGSTEISGAGIYKILDRGALV